MAGNSFPCKGKQIRWRMQKIKFIYSMNMEIATNFEVVKVG